MDTISDAQALDIERRINIINKHFDPLREHETHFPEDDINNYNDDMLPYFVTFEERALFAFYEWIRRPPKRWQAWCTDPPYIEDDFYNVLGTISITNERLTDDGKVYTIRLHSYNRFDYHGTYNEKTHEVKLIANRKFW